MSSDKRSFIIASPPYNEINGGAIVLHKLCHLLNQCGYCAYIYPFYGSAIYNIENGTQFISESFRIAARRYLKRYTVNSNFLTPIFHKSLSNKKLITVYPEIVIGNPLKAQNVVRWFLCEPGTHTSVVSINKNDLLVDFRSFLTGFTFGKSIKYPVQLYITHIPLDIFNLNEAVEPSKRRGSAYCLRKGKHRQIVHDLKDSILIDGKSHLEVAKILKSVKTFYSYDLYTAYSWFATLCGASSIVVPQDGLDSSQWFPESQKPYGVAYGSSELEYAHSTAALLQNKLIEDESKMIEHVKIFADFAISHFAL